MKNIILKIKNTDDFYEKYSNKVSRDIFKYLIDECRYIKGNVKVIIHNQTSIKNIDKLIKDGLNEYLKECKRMDNEYNKKQILFFIVGLIFIMISTLVTYKIINEVIIIAAWVVIWEVVDISFNLDVQSNYSKKIIKKLINSEFIIDEEN